MNSIPPKLREALAEDPFYQECALRQVHTCQGRITWEHALEYRGSQLQERFAIVPICEYFHTGPGLNKKRNRWVALNRMTEEDFKKYDRAGFKQQKLYLNKIYGVWKLKKSSKSQPTILGFTR